MDWPGLLKWSMKNTESGNLTESDFKPMSEEDSKWLSEALENFQFNEMKEIMKDMAKIVDEQNKDDKKYIKMSNNFDRSLAFKTACDLIFKGKEQPSGYTEPLLHKNRLKKKLI